MLNSPHTHTHTHTQAKLIDGKIHFRGLVASPDGKKIFRTERYICVDMYVYMHTSYVHYISLCIVHTTFTLSLSL